MRNGLPRVGRASRSPSGPYDTHDLQAVLARLQHEAQEGPPGDLEQGDEPIPRRLIDKASAFLDRLIDEHWTKRIIPADPKDPTASVFGAPTKESTITWGQQVDMSFTQNPPVGPEPTFPITSQQIVQVMRPHPTTHTTLVVFSFGQNWSGENQTTITINYTLGVGQVRVTIPKIFVLSAGDLANASNTTPIVDVNVWPLQSIQVSASLTLSPANNGLHPVLATGFVAPRVQ